MSPTRRIPLQSSFGTKEHFDEKGRNKHETKTAIQNVSCRCSEEIGQNVCGDEKSLSRAKEPQR